MGRSNTGAGGRGTKGFSQIADVVPPRSYPILAKVIWKIDLKLNVVFFVNVCGLTPFCCCKIAILVAALFTVIVGGARIHPSLQATSSRLYL